MRDGGTLPRQRVGTPHLHCDESGMPTGQTVDHERDMSEYSLSGDITDHRDGTVSIKMGKPTEVEALRAQLADTERAAKILLMEEK